MSIVFTLKPKSGRAGRKAQTSVSKSQLAYGIELWRSRHKSLTSVSERGQSKKVFSIRKETVG